jgi:transcriptional regulator with XRE-family HTH domain
MGRPRNERSQAWAEKVREQRIAHGWSQRELGDLLGRSYRFIERIEEEHIVPPEADRLRLEELVKISKEESAELRGTTVPLARLRYVRSDIDMYRTLSTGEVCCRMSVTLHNPNDFQLRFKTRLWGWINEKDNETSPTKFKGYIDPNSDVTLENELICDFRLTRTPKPGLPCVLALLDYDIWYKPAFGRGKRSRKGAQLRFISEKWPLKDEEGRTEFDSKGYLDDEIEK